MFHKGKIILFLIIIYYSLPKIDLFYIPGSLTGIRVQDLIALIIFIVFFKTKVKIKPFYLILFLFGHTVYSITLWNNFQGVIGTFRLIEYYSIGLGIYYLIQVGLFDRFFKIAFAILASVTLLQYYLIIPNVDPGRGLLLSSQFSGTFGTPAELSYYTIAILFLYNQVQQKTGMHTLVALLVALNGVKAVILGFLVLLWSKLKSLHVVLKVLLICCIFFFIYLGREMLFAAIEFLSIVYKNISLVDATFSDLKKGGTIDVEEASLSYRIGKWTNSLSLMYQYPTGLIFGFGIYSQGGAVDGGILRFLYEFGLLIFIALTIHLLRISFTFVLILIAVNFLFDAYMSSVVMPVLLASYLYLISKKENNRIEI